MRKILLILLFPTILLSSDKIIELLPYEYKPDYFKHNIIIIINQIEDPLSNQKVMNLLKKRRSNDQFNYQFPQLIKGLFQSNYQIIFVSYLNRNELYNPFLSHIHLFQKYNTRASKKRLTTERRIIESGFDAMNEFYKDQYIGQPLCMIFHLPPKNKFNLEEKNSNDQRTFDEKRDFSIVNLYHEIHSRKLYPNKLLIYPNLDSTQAILINNL